MELHEGMGQSCLPRGHREFVEQCYILVLSSEVCPKELFEGIVAAKKKSLRLRYNKTKF